MMKEFIRHYTYIMEMKEFIVHYAYTIKMINTFFTVYHDDERVHRYLYMEIRFSYTILGYLYVDS